MDSWYKIRDDMSKTHKKHMVELKKLYEASLSAKKKQEAVQNARLDQTYSELKDIRSEVQAEHNLLSEIKKKCLAVTEKYELRKKQVEDERNTLVKERVALNQAMEESDREEEARGMRMKEVNGRITDRNAELNKLEANLEEKIARNDAILDAIEDERWELSQEKTKIQDASLDLKEKQHVDKVAMKEKTDKLTKFGADVSRLKLNRAELANRELLFNKKIELWTAKQNDQKMVDEILNDKDISLKLWDAELSKKERRIQNLVDIHGLKKEMG